MPHLPELTWKTSYRHDDGDLIELFYNPALGCAKQYDRMTGYFSADALALASRGIDQLIANDGRMRLVVGCTLNPEETDAIGQGYEWRSLIESTLCQSDLTPPNESARTGLEMLAWMVAQGHLDVKVAVPIDDRGRPTRTTGIYHEKVGILTDEAGDRISFSGSINETAGGWINNRESFHVYLSWEGGRESRHVDDEVDAFARLWDDRSPSIKVFDFPDAAKKKLLEYLPTDDRFVSPMPGGRRPDPDQPEIHRLLPDEYQRIAWTFFRYCGRLANGLRAGEMTSAVSPWPHQIRTYTRFIQEWPSRLLIADEVGLGKTISAGLIIRQAWMAGKAKRILVMAPKGVLIQWQNELYEKFNLDVPIYDGTALNWRTIHGVERASSERVAKDAWQQQSIVLVSSYLMRRQDRVRELLEAPDWDLIVLDEAHHARRRGAGTDQEKGPNALLALMQRLQAKALSLLLLSATPMQVHPVEIWDLINLLGLPVEWKRNDASFLQYFGVAASNPANEKLEYLARMFQDVETTFGPISELECAKLLPEVSGLRRRKVLAALRDSSAIPRKTLDSDSRKNMIRILQAVTPLRYRMIRNTRELLRQYRREGKLPLPVPDRDVRDVPVDMLAAERTLYKQVEDYISDTYKTAAPDKRSAVGFIMTVYRRRLASSFEAFRRTLTNRLARIGGAQLPASPGWEEDVSLDETKDDVMSGEEASELATSSLQVEEKARINALLKGIAQLSGTDSKAKELKSQMQTAFADGYDSAIVFTQYTDTMEYLRDHLAGELDGIPIASYSGAGGAWRDHSGSWVPCSKEEIKRRLRSKNVRLLICSDAAGEGLNLQTCGVLVNYDLPWNPMKVEQRIGRIDRIGQAFPKVRVINLAYKDTVEYDVFFTIGQRIQLFQGIVGRLQPILSRLPKKFEELTLTSAEAREAARNRFLAEIEQQVAEDEPGFDLDAATAGDLDLPELPYAPLDLEAIEGLVQRPDSRPAQIDWRSMDARSYGIQMPGMPDATRVTTDARVFDESSDNHQLFAPGGNLFDQLAGAPGEPLPSDGGTGVCWLAEIESSQEAVFLVRTLDGLERVQSLGELLATLERLASPAPFPFENWPGCLVRLVA